MNDLSSFYDVAVIGTGLVESLIAAACSRSGLRVLQVEETPFFGDSNTTVNLDELTDWIKFQQNHASSSPFSDFSISENKTHPLSQLLQKKAKMFNLDITPHVVPCKGGFLSFYYGSLFRNYLEFIRVECTTLLQSSSQHGSPALVPIPQSIQEILTSSLSSSEQYHFVPLLKSVTSWDGLTDTDAFFQGYAHKPFSQFLKKLHLDGTRLSSFISYCMCGYPSGLFILHIFLIFYIIIILLLYP